MSTAWKHVTTILLVAVFTIAIPPVDTVLDAAGTREASTHYVKNFSYGFRDRSSIYFLLEYKVYRRRRPVWFIMPIERSPVYYYYRIFFYRFDIETDRLEQLATLRDETSPQTSVKNSLFTGEDHRIVFAFYSGWDRERGTLYELRVWDPHVQRFVGTPVGTELGSATSSPVPREDPRMQHYFADYRSPWEANPGVITITELKTSVLADVTDEQWDLPREW